MAPHATEPFRRASRDWWSFLLKNGAGFWDGVGAARHAAFLLETIASVPLRNAIATYVGAARNVPCSSDQFIISSGAQKAFDPTERVLIDLGDTVWMEEPEFQGMRGALLAAGAKLAPYR